MIAHRYFAWILFFVSFNCAAEGLNEFLELFQATPLEETTAPVATYVKPDMEKSCVELYLEITELLDQQNQARAGYWSDNKNQLAGAAATVFKPAVIYLGYSAIQHLQATEATAGVASRVRTLRMVSADKRCFVD